MQERQEGKNMTIQEQIDEIIGLEEEPGVYSVFVGRTDWSLSYVATARFRGHGADEVSARADTVEKALLKLKDYVLARHCPHCGALLKEVTDGQ
jgi:hypothetical protein